MGFVYQDEMKKPAPFYGGKKLASQTSRRGWSCFVCIQLPKSCLAGAMHRLVNFGSGGRDMNRHRNLV
jgi:hypothetical protein